MSIEDQLKQFQETSYLGDGAYVGSRGYDICIFTADGISILNRVYLGDNEIVALENFIKMLRERSKENVSIQG